MPHQKHNPIKMIQLKSLQIMIIVFLVFFKDAYANDQITSNNEIFMERTSEFINFLPDSNFTNLRIITSVSNVTNSDQLLIYIHNLLNQNRTSLLISNTILR